MKTKLRLLTNSALSTYRRCPKEYELTYLRGYRPVTDAEALRVGTMVHAGLELWWCGRDLDDVLHASVKGAASDYEAAKVRAMLRGYHARWSDDRASFEVVAVEREFRMPLVNPDSGAASRTYELGGKVDVLTSKGIVEHKTSSSDVGIGSVYWRKLAMNSQVSTYYAGARSLGVEPRSCVYDVLKKPALRPLKATPEESRKYTKDGRLYAAQRDVDELPEEYEQRIMDDIASKPDAYFQRGEVVRLDQEERDYARDVWQLAQSMREAERIGMHVRNTDACERYSGLCGFFDYCSGAASLDDQSQFVRVDNVHPELSTDAAAAE